MIVPPAKKSFANGFLFREYPVIPFDNIMLSKSGTLRRHRLCVSLKMLNEFVAKSEFDSVTKIDEIEFQFTPQRKKRVTDSIRSKVLDYKARFLFRVWFCRGHIFPCIA